MKTRYSLGSRKKTECAEQGIFPCFHFNQDLDINELRNSKNIFFSVVKDMSERDKLYTQAEELALLYVNNFKEKFEEELNESYSLRFYAIILKSYYFPLILFTLSKYLYLKKFFKIHASEDIVIDTYSDNSFKGFQSKDEFIINLYSNSEFQEWISSIVVQKISPKNVQLNFIHDDVPLNKVDFEDKFLHSFKSRLFCKMNLLKPHRIFYLFAEFLSKTLGYRFMIFNNIYGVSHFRSIFYSLMLQARCFLNKKVKVSHNELNYNRDSKNYFDERFIEILDFMVERTHPYGFKKFSNMISEVKKNYNFDVGKIRFDRTAIYDEVTAFKHALSAEKGEKLVFVQHGSHYETYTHSLSADCYEYLGDFFIKWGNAPKKMDKFCKFIYMPSPKLSYLKDKHRFKTDRIIFVSSNWKFLLDGIAWVDPVNMISYLEEKINLIQKLDALKHENIFFRPWLNVEYESFDEIAFFKKIKPNLKILEGALSREILSCKLLILDHYGTTLYEAMVANVPTMIYFGYPEQSMTDETQEVFYSLKRVGILHDNSTTLINNLSSIVDQVESWWAQSERQAARQEFLEAFASTDKNWNLEWLKLLTGSELLRGC